MTSGGKCESIQNLSFSDFAKNFGGNSPLPQNLFSPCKIPLCIYKNCKHLQVLVQFGESRKIVEVVNGEDLASVLHKVKTLFTIDGKTVLQQYDDDWETWLDLVDVRMLKHRETIRLILSEQEEGKKQVFTNSDLD